MMRSSSKPKVVALLIETSNAYSRGLLAGIRSWVRQHSGWTIHLSEQGRGNTPPLWLERWHGDGIIARFENREIMQAVRKTGLPVVNVSASGLTDEYPVVISDSAAIARLAAQHLLDRGFRHFGYFGDARFRWAASHGENFAAFLARRGLDCSIFPVSKADQDDWEAERERLAGWLRAQPQPVGIMACYDIRGQMLLEACRYAGLRVPEEVAVIGQHNDELLCDLCDPPLSSVIPNAPRAGYEATALLEAMMRGRRPRRGATLIPPLGVATRQSTDIIALEDKEVAAAIRFIRENACSPIGVPDLLRHVPLSRTLLERRFKRLIGRGVYEEIIRARVHHVRDLLAASDLSLAEIADRCSFSSVGYLNAFFKTHTGQPPGAYRRSIRLAPLARGLSSSPRWRH